MNRILDIAPMRSLVAVADQGGFQRAATYLHLSQAAVSQHVRRLEAATGRPLVERHGRGSRFTAHGDRLVVRARRILELHDETLRDLGTEESATITVGATEHAAAQLLPALAASLAVAAPQHRFRFRIERGTRLREGLGAGSLDLALMFAPEVPQALPVGELALDWFSSPTWSRPPGPVPVVAFDSPCALRSRALETLSSSGVDAVVGAEATQLAGVQAAVGAGLGVAVLATLGQTPPGLVAREDLPRPGSLPLYVCARAGLPEQIAQLAAEAVRPLLTPVLSLARGA